MMAASLRRTRRLIERKLKLKILRLKHRQIVHFLHIGKTGGSSVKFALREAAGGNWLSTEQVLAISDSHAVLLHAHQVRFVDVPVGERVAFVLRDPVSRFVSGFYSRYREAKPRKYVPWSPDEKVAFDRFQTPNQLATALSSDDAAARAAAESAMLAIGHVNTTYRKWLTGEAYLRSRASDILFIGNQEQLSEDFLRFQEKLGMRERVGLPQDPVTSHRTPETFDKRLDDAAVRNLQHWYRDDYVLIRLCRELNAEGI